MANVAKAVSTSKVLLVPYEKHHVHKYHTWMQDPVSFPLPTPLNISPKSIP